jgi:ketosteroid isomerase-like protein
VTDNVKLAKESFDAFKRGDIEKYIGYFSGDVEWKVSAYLTGKVAYRGHDGIREFFAEVDRLYDTHDEEFFADYDDFQGVGEDRVIALGEGGIKRERDPLDFEVGLVYRFEDGKITALEAYTSHQEARQAAGLE